MALTITSMRKIGSSGGVRRGRNPKEPLTRVVFRKWPDSEGGEVIALFPDEEADYSGHISSYQHTGQHAAASRDITYRTKAATPAEYAGLKRELESIGYRLKVARRMARGRRRNSKRSPSLWLLEQNVGGVWKPRFRGPDKRGVEMILPTQKELHPGSKWRIRRHVTGSKKNPSRARGANRIFEVHVPDSPGDMGYKIKIRAKTVSAAREEARKYCAKQSVRHIHGGGGRAGSGQFLRDIYKLPPGTKVKEVSQ